MKILLTVLLQLGIVAGLLAQPASFVVQLKENFNRPEAQYFYGDFIEVRLGEDWISGAITKADSNSLRIGKEEFLLSEIEAVRIRKSILRLFGSALKGGGLLYMGVVSANSLINNERPIIQNGELLGGTAAVGLGFLFNRLSYKDIELEDGWSLKVIQFKE